MAADKLNLPKGLVVTLGILVLLAILAAFAIVFYFLRLAGGLWGGS